MRRAPGKLIMTLMNPCSPLSSHDAPAGTAWLRRSVEECAADDDDDPVNYSFSDNALQFRLTDHFYGRSDAHSLNNFDDLLHVLRSDAFDTVDLTNFSVRKAEDVFEKYEFPAGLFPTSDR